MAVGHGSVWAVDALRNEVDRIDPRSLRITDSIAVPGGANAISVGPQVWVANDRDATVSEIDPATNTVVQTLHVPPDATDLAVGFGAVWVTHRRGTLTRIDLATGAVRNLRMAAGSAFSSVRLTGIAADPADGVLWITRCPPGMACGIVGHRGSTA
jgi:virginiamycin B lyase